MTIKDFHFKMGDLVLKRHMAIEKVLNKKMRPRYTRPLIVTSCNKGTTYILAELDSSLLDRPVAVFHIIPYFTCAHIELPPLDKLLDMSIVRLCKLQNSSDTDTDEYLNDNNASSQPDDKAGSQTETDAKDD